LKVDIVYGKKDGAISGADLGLSEIMLAASEPNSTQEQIIDASYNLDDDNGAKVRDYAISGDLDKARQLLKGEIDE